MTASRYAESLVYPKLRDVAEVHWRSICLGTCVISAACELWRCDDLLFAYFASAIATVVLKVCHFL
jgi:hypothetical protein